MPVVDLASTNVRIRGPRRLLRNFDRLSTRERGMVLEMFQRYARGDREAIKHLVDRADPAGDGVAVSSTVARIMRVMAAEH